jgi:hypothetical protein
MQNTASITQRFINGLKPSSSARFIRDNALVGFGVKVMPTGRISFIVEARIRGGSSKRITLGQSPALSASKAVNAGLRLHQTPEQKCSIFGNWPEQKCFTLCSIGLSTGPYSAVLSYSNAGVWACGQPLFGVWFSGFV